LADLGTAKEDLRAALEAEKAALLAKIPEMQVGRRGGRNGLQE